MKTSHVRNRPFDFKLIDLVEPNPVLYLHQKGLSKYKLMKLKSEAWTQIAARMGCSVQSCLVRWSNLRGQYQKEFRRCQEFCPREGRVLGSTWPYFQRLQFLENTLQCNRLKVVRALRSKKHASKKNIKTSVCEDNADIETALNSDASIPNKLNDSEESNEICSYSEIVEQLKDFIQNNEQDVMLDNMLKEDTEMLLETELNVSQAAAKDAMQHIFTDDCTADSNECDDAHIDVVDDLQTNFTAEEAHNNEFPISICEKLSNHKVSEQQNSNDMDSTVILAEIAHLLSEFDGEVRMKIERRILSYLCRFQLHILNNLKVCNLSI